MSSVLPPRAAVITQAAWLMTGLLLSWLLGSVGTALALAALAGDLWLTPRAGSLRPAEWSAPVADRDAARSVS